MADQRARVGHHRTADGRSAFRVFAPQKTSVGVLLDSSGERHPLTPDGIGWWIGELPRPLPHGTRYWLEVDGRRLPDPASRGQPQGVHGPSAVVDVVPVVSPGWTGVAMADAVLYELHVGTFTPDGTLADAQAKLPHLSELGINAVELLPLAEFPGERNWGYDGTYLFAVHHAYGSHADLKAFTEAAHRFGIAVILDVVYNHFGPEGNYAGALAPYTKAAATPWGAAINFDGAWNHGVREFFLANTRFWLEEVGVDGFRMDAVSLVFDTMPQHILRQITDSAAEIGRRQGRHVLTIAEHLRNDRFVTLRDGAAGFGYDAQWNDDLNHAVFAKLTGETDWRHYQNFGSFDDVVKALTDGFVLDGTRFDRYYQWFVGTDGRLTRGSEHVVHIQNHDQVGNRLHGDRLIATYGRDKALVAITAVMASPFVPMLFMGEEYGETAPFLFFEDFGDAGLVAGVRAGRKADFAFDGGVEPPDPHDRATFVASKLDWQQRAGSAEGRAILAYYKGLIALKRAGRLGPRDRDAVEVTGDAATDVITVEAPQTLTVLNLSAEPRAFDAPDGWRVALDSASLMGGAATASAATGMRPAYSALILRRDDPPAEVA